MPTCNATLSLSALQVPLQVPLQIFILQPHILETCMMDKLVHKLLTCFDVKDVKMLLSSSSYKILAALSRQHLCSINEYGMY